MPIISLFDHSLKLELVLSELEHHQIKQEMILAKSVDKTSIEKKYLDPYNSDGLNLFLVSSLGMVFMLIGAIYGFDLYIGPVLCALIGLVTGSIIGFCLDYYFKKRVHKKTLKENKLEVILIVNCEENNYEMVEEILKSHQTLGFVRI